MRVIVEMTPTEYSVSDGKEGRKYHNLVEEQQLYDHNGQAVQRSIARISLKDDRENLDRAKAAVKAGQTIQADVRVFAVGGSGGRPFVTYFDGVILP